MLKIAEFPDKVASDEVGLKRALRAEINIAFSQKANTQAILRELREIIGNNREKIESFVKCSARCVILDLPLKYGDLIKKYHDFFAVNGVRCKSNGRAILLLGRE